MAISDSDSAVLFTGSVQVKKGIEYASISGTGNTLIPTENIKLSINRSAFAEVPAYQPMLVSPTFLYTFEKDSVLLVGNYVVPEFYVTSVNYSGANVSLSANTESGQVVSVSDIGGKEVTAGEVSSLAYIENARNQDATCIVRYYTTTGGLIYTSSLINLPENTSTNVVTTFDISGTTIVAGDSVWFTVEADAADNTILGGDTLSQIRLVRKNL